MTTQFTDAGSPSSPHGFAADGTPLTPHVGASPPYQSAPVAAQPGFGGHVATGEIPVQPAFPADPQQQYFHQGQVPTQPHAQHYAQPYGYPAPHNALPPAGPSNRQKLIQIGLVAAVGVLVIAVLALLVFRPTTEVQPESTEAENAEENTAPANTEENAEENTEEVTEAEVTNVSENEGPVGPNVEGPDTGETTLVVDESDLGTVQLEVPAEWSDAVGEDMASEDGSVTGREITVSSDAEAYFEAYTTPGMWLLIASSPSFDTTGFLDELEAPSACVYDGRGQMVSDTLEGEYEIYTDCGGSGVGYWVGALQVGEYAVMFDANVPDSADGDAVTAALASLEIDLNV